MKKITGNKDNIYYTSETNSLNSAPTVYYKPDATISENGYILVKKGAPVTINNQALVFSHDIKIMKYNEEVNS